MPVQLILDYFAIDDEDALQVESSDISVNTINKHIMQHLRESLPSLCRIRLSNEALYHRFEYLEGMEGVLPSQALIPRLLLAEKLKITLPDWLLNKQIVALGLLHSQTLNTGFDCFEKMLLTDLITAQDFYVFIAALSQQRTAFLSLLANDNIKNCLLDYLVFNLNIAKETASLFITELMQFNDINGFLNTLAYQQHLFRLRCIINQYSLGIALAAQKLPTPLLSLPLLSLTEIQGQTLVEKFLVVLNSMTRKIVTTEIPAEVLAELLIVDWSALWLELNTLIELSPCLINDTLVQKIATFTSQEAIALTENLKQNSYPLLDKSASIEEVLAWSEGYFNYCRHAFSYKQTLDETINGSFTDWLLAQKVRIARSNSDWRHCSQRINEFLQADYLVVVIIIDALSVLNQDVLLAELSSLTQQDHLTLYSEVLFSPLPTLTEVGKMAVLTGKSARQLPNNQEEALRETYQRFLSEPQALKIVRSWKESTEHLETQTNLLVFFENRLDERLHDCISFEKHRADLKPISSQIKTSIQRWTKDAMSLGRDIVFLITADHGMTVTQKQYSSEKFGDIKERVFKLKSTIELPNDFVKIDDYAVPKTRIRLTPNAVLTHGGLTPEEVLIPFITFTTKLPTPSKTPIEIKLENNQCRRINDKQWQLDLLLTAEVTVSNIRLKLSDSFIGQANIDSIRANGSQKLVLSFRSTHEQIGLVQIELLICYNRLGDYEENYKSIAVNFPQPLLERDAGAQSFEDMF